MRGKGGEAKRTFAPRNKQLIIRGGSKGIGVVVKLYCFVFLVFGKIIDFPFDFPFVFLIELGRYGTQTTLL